MPRYRAVFFDAGFTVIDMRVPEIELLRRVTCEQGLRATPSDLKRAQQAARAFFSQHYYRPNDIWSNDAAILAFWTAYYRTALEALRWPAEQAQEAAADLAAALEKPEMWRPFPEAPAVLAGLKESGYRVGILSDWSSGLPAILDALGLAAYADFAVVSAIEGVAKPQPRFFQIALERAGVAPGEVLMVGDNHYADIQGASQVGIRGLLLDRDGRQQQPTQTIIRHLEEVWGHLA